MPGRFKNRSLDRTSQGARANAGGRRVTAETVEWKAKQKAFDESFGFHELESGPPRIGWLLNFNTSVAVSDNQQEASCLELFFLQQDGTTFKVFYDYRPYFFVEARANTHKEVASYLQRRFQTLGAQITIITKRDMDQRNHLSGIKQDFIKLSFKNIKDLMFCRKQIMPIAAKNKAQQSLNDAYGSTSTGNSNVADNIVGLREYDVPYHIRVAIDNEIRVGLWYRVTAAEGNISIEPMKDMIVKVCLQILSVNLLTYRGL